MTLAYQHQSLIISVNQKLGPTNTSQMEASVMMILIKSRKVQACWSKKKLVRVGSHRHAKEHTNLPKRFRTSIYMLLGSRWMDLLARVFSVHPRLPPSGLLVIPDLTDSCTNQNVILVLAKSTTQARRYKNHSFKQ